MYITVENGYVVLKQAFRDSEGKPKNRHVQSFGRRDKMSDEEFAALRQKYANQETKPEVENKALLNSILAVKPMPKTDLNGVNKCYAHLIVRHMFKELGLDKFLLCLLTEKFRDSSEKYLDIFLTQLTYRTIASASHQNLVFDGQFFLGHPDASYEKDSARLFKYLGKHKEDIMSFVAGKYQAAQDNATKQIHYDITRSWLDNPYSDQEWSKIRFAQIVRSIEENLSLNQEQKSYALKAISNVNLASNLFQMRKGRRAKQSLNQLVLTVNKNSVPLDFSLVQQDNALTQASVNDAVGCCVLCVLGLMLLTELKNRIQAQYGVDYPVQALAQVLGSCKVTYLRDFKVFRTCYDSEKIEALGEETQIIRARLIKVSGLKEPMGQLTLQQLSNCLKKRFKSIEDAIGS